MISCLINHNYLIEINNSKEKFNKTLKIYVNNRIKH